MSTKTTGKTTRAAQSGKTYPVDTKTGRNAAQSLERWLRDATDADALAGLHATASALATAGGPSAALARCLENLLSCVLDESLIATEPAARLVAEAFSHLDDDDAQLGDLMERIDIFASGMTDTALGDIGESPARNDPPVLTEREDGSRIKPGQFDDQHPADPGREDEPPRLPEWPAEPPSSTSVKAIVDALDAAVRQLRDQLRGLAAHAQATDAEDFQRAMRELSTTAAELERLKEALADWSAESAALLEVRAEPAG